MTKLPRSETNCERNPNKRTTLEHTTLTNNLKIPMRTLPALVMAFCSAMMVYHFFFEFPTSWKSTRKPGLPFDSACRETHIILKSFFSYHIEDFRGVKLC